MKLQLLPVAAFLAAAFLAAPAPLAAQTFPVPEDTSKPCPKPCCGYDCADSCSNKPFLPTDCKTTELGPARSNIVIGSNALASTNMLYCPGGTEDKPRPYALCFFSGPTTPTGLSGWTGTKNTLKCTPDFTNGIANCQCQVYNTSSYYVDINSILNLGAFWETQKICGHDGARCKNIAGCDDNGNQKTSCPGGPCPTCTDTTAPVCKYIAAQPYDKEGAFYPKSPYSTLPRIDLVSTFSFAMGTTAATGNPYQLGSTPCTNGIYAGCMTAPCAFVEGNAKTDGSVVNCACPMWQGDYQIGQPQKNLAASVVCPAGTAGWIWSAANAVPAPPKPTKPD